ncbi:cGMP-dependent protein kinase interacting domain [Trinorchestia longiramus]|nr:cGMP-dependent protein kinase interacting domain [Trinorchestia longiramus]
MPVQSVSGERAGEEGRKGGSTASLASRSSSVPADGEVDYKKVGVVVSIRAYTSRWWVSLSASERTLQEGGSRCQHQSVHYKKLYEEQLGENERLVERLRTYERDLRGAREAIESANRTNSSKLASAESDRREKRALERKLSEMEEELRQLQKLKAENEKLKAENRALTRVVSKLTSTAALGVHGAK